MSKFTDLAGTTGSRVATEIVHLASVDSTMRVAHEMVARAAGGGTTVIADQQLAGRGREQRLWVSSADDLTMSFILYPRADYAKSISIACVLAIVDCLRQLTDLPTAIKWPNDVFLNQRKVAGMLVDLSQTAEQISAVVGIGLNVNMPADSEAVTDYNATSLKVATGTDWDRYTVLETLLKALNRRLEHLEDDTALAAMTREWAANLIDINRRVTVRQGTTTVFQGIVTGIDRYCRLEITAPDSGQRYLADAAEVVIDRD